MDESLPFLPHNAIAAFTRLYPHERPTRPPEKHRLRLADLFGSTVALELGYRKVLLRLSQDCPFEEISPAYLAIFVHRLSQLCPDVSVAYLEKYHHPIVATLPLSVGPEESPEAWASAIQSTVERLKGVLARQEEASRGIASDGPEPWTNRWPEVEVTTEQLAAIGELADDFARAQARGDSDELLFHEERLFRRVRTFGILKPERHWIPYLRLDELESGFWRGIRVNHFTASQLAVTLNVVYQGNRYNTTLVDRACTSGLFSGICGRARELAEAAGDDSVPGQTASD